MPLIWPPPYLENISKMCKYKIDAHYFCASFGMLYMTIKGTQFWPISWFDRNFYGVAIFQKIMNLWRRADSVVVMVSFENENSFLSSQLNIDDYLTTPYAIVIISGRPSHADDIYKRRLLADLTTPISEFWNFVVNDFHETHETFGSSDISEMGVVRSDNNIHHIFRYLEKMGVCQI